MDRTDPAALPRATAASAATPLLLQVLREPARMGDLRPAQWDDLVRQARHAGLLARLEVYARGAGVAEHIPGAPRAHLHGEWLRAQAQAEEARREVRHVLAALRDAGVGVILLKGAAYLMAGLPAAEGRSFTDVDILVPKAQIDLAESALAFHGWETTHHDPYDQRYYREWMHELPPMLHRSRGTVLDVHHTILPETARLRPPAHKLIAAAMPLPGTPDLRVLAPTDMVLHSLVHLFHNEEMARGLRDLTDVDLLTRHFGVDPGFWGALVARAAELGLQRTLYYGVQQLRHQLRTPVPEAAQASLHGAAPSPGVCRLMQAVWTRALAPLHASCRRQGSAAALALVFVRAHWLRMPAPLLAQHLAHKAHRALRPAEAARANRTGPPEPAMPDAIRTPRTPRA